VTKYRGFIPGDFQTDEDDRLITGQVMNSRDDLITFNGYNEEELTKSFHESVDLYMEDCLEYKGHVESIKQEENYFYGYVINKPKLCCIYEGKTLEELEKNFRDLIDF